MIRQFIDKLLGHKKIKALVNDIYTPRRDRDVHPEGGFDEKGRWWPNDREDQLASFSSIGSPRAGRPYSYMLRARTRAHCRLLVRAWLLGRVHLKGLPDDAQKVIRRHAKNVGLACRATMGRKARAKYARQILLDSAGVA